MATLKLWSEGKEMIESGVEIGGIQVTWAEIDLATDRASAIDIGMTSDLCDDFEVDHKDYADLPYWLDMVAAKPLLRQTKTFVVEGSFGYWRDRVANDVCGCDIKHPGQDT